MTPWVTVVAWLTPVATASDALVQLVAEEVDEEEVVAAVVEVVAEEEVVAEVVQLELDEGDWSPALLAVNVDNAYTADALT